MNLGFILIYFLIGGVSGYAVVKWMNKSAENAVLIFRFDQMDKAIETLQNDGFTILTGAQICSL